MAYASSVSSQIPVFEACEGVFYDFYLTYFLFVRVVGGIFVTCISYKVPVLEDCKEGIFVTGQWCWWCVKWEGGDSVKGTGGNELGNSEEEKSFETKKFDKF